MKIFFPVEVFFPSQAGGPANTVYWLCRNLKRNGFKPVIVATDKGIQPSIALDKWTETDAGQVIYVKTTFNLFPVRQILISLGQFASADVIQLSSMFFPTAFVTAFAARLFSKRILWSPRGELDPGALIHSKGRKRPVLGLIKLLIGTYAQFHTTCDEETKYVFDNFGETAKVVQLPNYIEIPDQVSRNPDSYFLYIGRLHPKKGIDNLIRGLAASVDFRHSGRILKIAGRGNTKYESELKSLIEELELTQQIQFIGQVEGAAKQQLLADAFWTIVPSHTENFGIVVLESMAQQTPVIASKGTPWATLEENNVGIWTNNAPTSLASAIDRTLSMSGAKYADIRSRCREFVVDHFDIEKNIGKWITAYNDFK